MNSIKLYKFLEDHMDNIYDIFVEGKGEIIESIQFIDEIRHDRETSGAYILIKTCE